MIISAGLPPSVAWVGSMSAGQSIEFAIADAVAGLVERALAVGLTPR